MRLPSTLPSAPLPVGESKSATLAVRDAALLGGANDRHRERMLAGPLDACGKPQHVGLGESGRGNDGGDGRLAFRQGAGLVDHQRIDLLHMLQRFGVLDQDAGLRAAADADHDRHRRREAKRAGAGDDQHRDRGDKAVGEARLRTPDRPGGKGEQRDRNHGRHEPAGDLVGHPLNRRAAALRLGDELHDLRQHRVAADLSRSMISAPDWFMVPPMTVAPVSFVTGIDSPVTMRFVDGAAAFDDNAIDRHLFAGPHAQPVADMDLIERHFFLAAVGANAPRGLRREIEQRADGAAGRLARAQFQHLAEQDQHGDDGGRFEIDRDGAVRPRKAAGKSCGASVATTL